VTAATVAVPPAGPTRRSLTWWGMMMVISTEGTIFLCLLAAWFFLRASAHEWPPPGVEAPELSLSLPFSFVLWGSSLPVLWAEWGLKRMQLGVFRAGMAISWLMGLSFFLFTLKDFDDLTFGWRDHAYGSAFYVIVGLHSIHLVIGLVMSAMVQLKAALGRYDRGHHRSAEAVTLYWHFIDVVWLFVYPSLFLSTHIHG
jgi:heme/copper-type cytochrome/quinol oxidase subunit 3